MEVQTATLADPRALPRALALAALPLLAGCGKDGRAAPGDVDLLLLTDPEMVLRVHARWTDDGGTDSWVEYRFEGEAWLIAPTTAPGEAVLLGIPAETGVEARAVQILDGERVTTSTQTARTGSLPPALLAPVVSAYDPARASPEPYAMTSVALGYWWGGPPYFIEIYDRRGRIVWYREVPDDLLSLSPGVARDGTHIWFEASNIFGMSSAGASVTRQTLDGRWTVKHPLASLGQGIAEGPDQGFWYEERGAQHALAFLAADGTTRTEWDCGAYFSTLGLEPDLCLMNATNWDEARNTVLVSQFETSTVFEIDLATHAPIRQLGTLVEGDPYTFDPPESTFTYQHFPHWTAEGTLLVSTHVPCAKGDPGCSTSYPGLEGVQLAAEYTVDDAAKTLTRVGYVESTDLWASQAGEAYRVANGNLIQGYGQDAAIREIAPDGATVWQVEWARVFGYRMIGHTSLIADLYALNAGP